jgi:hypothetical protein
MEYNQKICLERVEFHDLLASGHDCATYLNFSLFFTTLLGFSFLGGVHYCLSLQNEIDGLVQVKKSLMEHIYSLEEELRARSTEDEQEQEQEQEQEELDDLAEDTKPHTD